MAIRHLERQGYRVVARNQRVGRGELDIIVRRGAVLAFVEVKARRTRGCGVPEEAVTVRKQRQIVRLAQLWMAARPSALAGVEEVRLDVVAVDLAASPAAVRHLPAAFVQAR